MALAKEKPLRAERKPRVTQEARSAATREKLIQAAIYCLHRYGYSATTTTLVSDEAGLSRGAMLHQFGTRVDLMLAVARAIVDEQNALMREGVKRFPPGKERFLAMTDLTWEVMSRPAAIALLEIMMASRSDPDLGSRFPAMGEEFAKAQRAGAWALAQRAGIKDRETIDAMAQLHRATMQGLSIVLMFSRDPKSVQPGLDLLNWYKGVVTEKMVAEAEGRTGAVAAYLKRHPVSQSIGGDTTKAAGLHSSASELAKTGGRIVRQKSPRVRRQATGAHEERSAATRERLIEAAIVCLHRYGYSQTTTSLVAEQAGFTRGAMLHQFGTRVDLMLAVADHIVEQQNAFFRRELPKFAPGRERFMALTDLTWEAFSNPSAVALMEIMMACRSDPALGERFPALGEAFARGAGEGTWHFAQQAGITDKQAIDAMSQLHRAAFQGLSILRMFSRDPSSIEPGLELLRWYKAVLTEHLMEQAQMALG